MPVDPRGARIKRAGNVARLSDAELRELETQAPTGTTRRLARRIATERSRAIQAELRSYLSIREEIRVEIRRPRWMPGALFRRLLRSIVVEERAGR
jgi:hypothetical protein